MPSCLDPVPGPGSSLVMIHLILRFFIFPAWLICKPETLQGRLSPLDNLRLPSLHLWEWIESTQGMSDEPLLSSCDSFSSLEKESVLGWRPKSLQMGRHFYIAERGLLQPHYLGAQSSARNELVCKSRGHLCATHQGEQSPC